MSTLADLGIGNSSIIQSDNEQALTPDAEKYQDIGTLE